MARDISTEDKIKAAARRVFIAKGFSGCTSREIAKEAGINVALLNYYFCSKGQLFKLVCHAVMEDFMESMVNVFKLEMTLEQKVRIFIEREYDFLSKHPELSQFIFTEIGRSDMSDSFNHAGILKKIEETGVFTLSKEAQKKGEMKNVDIVSITLLIMSNCHFPIMARNLVRNIHQLTDEQYDQQLIIHKQYVIEMIVGYFFPQKS
jgi:AcrR family transcriptional regulator